MYVFTRFLDKNFTSSFLVYKHKTLKVHYKPMDLFAQAGIFDYVKIHIYISKQN